MSPVSDIQKMINAQTSGSLGTWKMAADGAGNNLFVHDWPDVPDVAARIVQYEGGPPTEVFGKPLYLRHPRIQVTVRGPKSSTVLSYVEDIYTFLNGITDLIYEGTHYSKIKGVGEPFEIGPDNSDREQAVANFSVDYYG
jgi:hypothetical protein